MHASRSPHEAKRNAGRSSRVAPIPDFAALHPGYMLHLHNVKQPSFFFPGSFSAGFSSFLFTFVAADPRARGLAERPETSSLDTCRAVTRDATLARHEPSRATRRHASRRSAVALSAQVPPPSPLPGPARRLHATSPMGWLRCRAFRVRGYRPRSTPHPAPPSGSPRESAPHERDVHVLPQSPKRSQ